MLAPRIRTPSTRNLLHIGLELGGNNNHRSLIKEPTACCQSVFRTRRSSHASPSPPICCRSPSHTGHNKTDKSLQSYSQKAFLTSRSAVCMLHLVVRDLFQVQVGGVDHLHAGVAVVSAAEGAPVFGVGREPVSLFSAALQRKVSVNQVDLPDRRHVPSTRPWCRLQVRCCLGPSRPSLMPVTNRAAVV